VRDRGAIPFGRHKRRVPVIPREESAHRCSVPGRRKPASGPAFLLLRERPPGSISKGVPCQLIGGRLDQYGRYPGADGFRPPPPPRPGCRPASFACQARRPSNPRKCADPGKGEADGTAPAARGNRSSGVPGNPPRRLNRQGRFRSPCQGGQVPTAADRCEGRPEDSQTWSSPERGRQGGISNPRGNKRGSRRTAAPTVAPAPTWGRIIAIAPPGTPPMAGKPPSPPPKPRMPPPPKPAVPAKPTPPTARPGPGKRGPASS